MIKNKWKREEYVYLFNMKMKGVSIDEIAKTLKRTSAAVHFQYYKYKKLSNILSKLDKKPINELDAFHQTLTGKSHRSEKPTISENETVAYLSDLSKEISKMTSNKIFSVINKMSGKRIIVQGELSNIHQIYSNLSYTVQAFEDFINITDDDVNEYKEAREKIKKYF